jgi:hypothetical protein
MPSRVADYGDHNICKTNENIFHIRYVLSLNAATVSTLLHFVLQHKRCIPFLRPKSCDELNVR